jgi:ElaB/YqjD/DUF883 family membrane-anchored ribosome-binding protein
MRGKEEGVAGKAQSVGRPDAEERELAKQVENLRKDLADLGSTVRSLAQAGTASAQRSVRDTTEGLARRGQDLAADARTAGQQAVEYGSEMFKDKYSEFETTVRKHPATAVALALGVGYLVGLLSRNRS